MAGKEQPLSLVGSRPVDARGAVGVQVGDGNVQIVYSYNRTWTDGVAPPPISDFRGSVDSPYRGLTSFDERDAAFFFGRERAATDVLERMTARLTDSEPLIVSGVSGAGKSSLLRAGVLHRLRGAGLPAATGSRVWSCLLFAPGAHPLAELAVQLSASGGLDASAVLGRLREDPATARELAQEVVLTGMSGQDPSGDGRAAGRIVVMIDQFEQVFTQCESASERQAFVHAVVAMSGSGPGDSTSAPALVVIGVRADFEARCADFPELAETVQNRYLVTPMTETELRQAITAPAEKVGGAVESWLVEILIRKAALQSDGRLESAVQRSGAGVLPLLSHALDAAWRERQTDILTVADYDRAGGLEGAIARSADRAYARLTSAQQAEARLVFTRLTVTDADGIDTAGRATTAELLAGRAPDQQSAINTVIEAFVAERLLTIAADSVEISHEALLAAWPLLRDVWLADDRADRVVRTRLQATANEWADHDHDPAYLYAGALLETATATAGRIAANPSRFPPLTTTSVDFLTASTVAVQRRARRRRMITIILSGLVILLALATIIALTQYHQATQQRDAAETQARIATAGRLAAQATAEVDTDLPQAMSDVARAYRMDPSPSNRQALWTVATGNPYLQRFVDIGDTITALAVSDDGSAVVAGDQHGRVVQLDTNGKIINRIKAFAGAITAIAVANGGTRLLVTDSRQVEEIRGERVVRMPVIANAHVLGMAVSPDGSAAVYSSQDDVDYDRCNVTLLDHADHVLARRQVAGNLTRLTLHHREVVGLDTGYGTWVRLDHRLDQMVRKSAEFGADNYAVAMSADGSLFGYTNGAETIPVWKTDSGKLKPFNANLYGHGPGHFAQELAISPDDKDIAVVDSGVAYVSALSGVKSSTDNYRATLPGFSRNGVSAVSFGGGRNRIIGASGRRLVFWNLHQLTRISIRKPAGTIFGCTACDGPQVNVAPDGHHATYVDSQFTELALQNLGTGHQLGARHDFSGAFGPTIWADNDTVVLSYADGKIGWFDGDDGAAKRLWQPVSHTNIVYLNWSRSGNLITVDTQGVIRLRDRINGTIIWTWHPPAKLGKLSLSGFGRQVAVDPGLRYLALSDAGRVVDLKSNDTEIIGPDINAEMNKHPDRPLDPRSAENVQYVGEHLIIGRRNTLELRNASGLQVQHSFRTGGGLGVPAADEQLSSIAYQQEDGRVVLVDVASGKAVGSLVVPASIDGRRTGLGFDRDGNELVTVTEGDDNHSAQIQLWLITPEALMNSICMAAALC